MSKEVLSIVPGWAEGRRQMAGFLERVRRAGCQYELHHRLLAHKRYGMVLCHSGGCYQRWSERSADEVILLAPPFKADGKWTDRELLKRAAARTRQMDARTRKAYHLRLRDKLRVALSVRSTIRHRQAVRSIKLVDELAAWLEADPSRKLTVLLYKDDPWTDLEAQAAFEALPRTKVALVTGDHDDLARRPEKAAELIARHTDLNLVA